MASFLSRSIPLAARIASRSLEFHWSRRLDAPSGRTAVGLGARQARSAHHATPRTSGKTRPRRTRRPGILRRMRQDRSSASRSWICRSGHVDRWDGQSRRTKEHPGYGAGWQCLRRSREVKDLAGEPVRELSSARSTYDSCRYLLGQEKCRRHVAIGI